MSDHRQAYRYQRQACRRLEVLGQLQVEVTWVAVTWVAVTWVAVTWVAVTWVAVTYQLQVEVLYQLQVEEALRH